MGISDKDIAAKLGLPASTPFVQRNKAKSRKAANIGQKAKAKAKRRAKK